MARHAIWIAILVILNATSSVAAESLEALLATLESAGVTVGAPILRPLPPTD